MAYKDRGAFPGTLHHAVMTLMLCSVAITGIAAGQNPIPLVNQPLVPDAVKPGSAGLKLTVNGTGFVPGAKVRWNGSPRTTKFVSQSRLTATVLSSDIAKPGTASITVFDPGPGGGVSNVVFFEVTPSSPSIELATSGITNTGDNPNSVTAGDFDGDGKLDLAVSDDNSNSIRILLGNGDGTFKPPVPYNVGSASESVAVGDFNGDGKLDLAVADLDGGDIGVLLGNGDGTFEAAKHYGAGSVPYWVVAGDFNGDGKLDLAVTNNGSSNFSVLLGNGDGTFHSAVNYAVGLDPTGMAVGDFNGDGKLDLVVGGNGISVFLGIGDGTFESAGDYPVGAVSISVGDFNGDGTLDLAAADSQSTDISVLLGNGDGTFRTAVKYAVGSETTSVAVGDLNSDGKLDLAVADDFGNSVGVLLGNGDGTFKAVANYSAEDPRSVAVGDFNGDGRLEIAVAEYSYGNTGVLLQIPIVSLSQSGLIFADQLVSSTSLEQTVNLTNVSGLSLNIGSIVMTGKYATDFSQSNDCSTLPPQAQCKISAVFTPTEIGPRAAAIIITDNGSGSPQSIQLDGTGVTSGPNATLMATRLNFVPQLLDTLSPAKSVKFANYGTLPLNIAGFEISKYFAEANSCGTRLAAGASCTIDVRFKPSQTGPITGTLSITDNAPSGTQTVHLNGAGTVVEVVPTSLSFGRLQQCKKESKTITLTNTGSAALNISDITVTGATVFTQTNNCGATVKAGQSCTVTATFTTGGLTGVKPGTYSGAIVISDNGGGGSETLPLSGFVVLCHECCF